MTPGRPSQPGPGPVACTHERPQDPLPSRLSPSPSSGSRCQTLRSPAPIHFHGPALRSPHTFTLSCERSPPSPLRTGVHVPGTSCLTGEDLADLLTAMSQRTWVHVQRPFLHHSVCTPPSPPPGTSTPQTIAGPTASLFPEVPHLPDSSPPLLGGLAPPRPTTTDPISHDPTGLPQHAAQAPQGVTTITPKNACNFPALPGSPGIPRQNSTPGKTDSPLTPRPCSQPAEHRRTPPL